MPDNPFETYYRQLSGAPAPSQPKKSTGGGVDIIRSAGERLGIAPELIDDYLNLTGGIESGNNPNIHDSVQGAKGIGQVMPDRPGAKHRTINGRRYDLTNPDENAEAGLQLFAAGGNDPVGRRLEYFGGADARRYYERTGKIPNIKDALGTTAQHYVQTTMPKGGAQSPTKSKRQTDPSNPFEQYYKGLTGVSTGNGTEATAGDEGEAGTTPAGPASLIPTPDVQPQDEVPPGYAMVTDTNDKSSIVSTKPTAVRVPVKEGAQPVDILREGLIQKATRGGLDKKSATAYAEEALSKATTPGLNDADGQSPLSNERLQDLYKHGYAEIDLSDPGYNSLLEKHVNEQRAAQQQAKDQQRVKELKSRHDEALVQIEILRMQWRAANAEAAAHADSALAGKLLEEPEKASPTQVLAWAKNQGHALPDMGALQARPSGTEQARSRLGLEPQAQQVDRALHSPEGRREAIIAEETNRTVMPGDPSLTQRLNARFKEAGFSPEEQKTAIANVRQRQEAIKQMQRGRANEDALNVAMSIPNPVTGSSIGEFTKLLPEDARTWANELVAKGQGQWLTAASGLIRNGVTPIAVARAFGAPDPITKPAADFLQHSAQTIDSVTSSIDQTKNRSAGSQWAQNVGAGYIGSAPAMVLMALGVPAGPAFALQASAEAQGQQKTLSDTVIDTAKGYAIGKLFELPLPKRLELLEGIKGNLARAGVKMPAVGAGTFVAEKLTGASNTDAAQAAATNALLSGTAEMTGLVKEGAKKAAEPIVRAESTPEWLRSRLAKATDIENVVFHDGERAMSTYVDPDTQGIGGTEIPLKDAGKRQTIKITPEQFDQLKDVVSGKAPAAAAPKQLTDTADSRTADLQNQFDELYPKEKDNARVEQEAVGMAGSESPGPAAQVAERSAGELSGPAGEENEGQTVAAEAEEVKPSKRERQAAKYEQLKRDEFAEASDAALQERIDDLSAKAPDAGSRGAIALRVAQSELYKRFAGDESKDIPSLKDFVENPPDGRGGVRFESLTPEELSQTRADYREQYKLEERGKEVAATPSKPTSKEIASAESPTPTEQPPRVEKSVSENKPGTKHEFSSTQVDLPQADAEAVKKGAQAIPDKNLYVDPKDESFGREQNPHVTVKFGLHTAEADDVRKVVESEPPIKVKIGKASIFPAKEGAPYDVVKLDVDSRDLHRLNKKIAKALPHTDTHPEYKPHITLAYVKPGIGQKYAGKKSPLTGREITINELTFSGKNGDTVTIPLKGNAEAAKLRSQMESAKQIYEQTIAEKQKRVDSGHLDRETFEHGKRILSERYEKDRAAMQARLSELEPASAQEKTSAKAPEAKTTTTETTETERSQQLATEPKARFDIGERIEWGDDAKPKRGRITKVLSPTSYEVKPSGKSKLVTVDESAKPRLPKPVQRTGQKHVGVPRSDTATNSEVDEVRARGGIKADPDGNNAGEIAWLKDSGVKGLVNEASGMTAERMAEALAQDGYGIGRWSGLQHGNGIDVGAFLDSIRDSISTGRHHYSSEKSWDDEYAAEYGEEALDAFEKLYEDEHGRELTDRVYLGKADEAEVEEFRELAKTFGVPEESIERVIRQGEANQPASTDLADNERRAEEPDTSGIPPDQLTEAYVDEQGTLHDSEGTTLFSRGPDALERLKESEDPEVARLAEILDRRALTHGNGEAGRAAVASLTRALDKYAYIRSVGLTVDQYLKQGALFEGNELTSTQEGMLRAFESNDPRKLDRLATEYLADVQRGGNDFKNEVVEAEQALLFRRRKADLESNRIRQAATGDLLREVNFTVRPHRMEINEAGREIFRRAYARRYFEHTGESRDLPFTGSFNDPKLVRDLIDELKRFAVENPAERPQAAKLASALKKAAADDGTAILYYDIDSLPEESFHRASYLAARVKSLTYRVDAAELAKTEQLQAVRPRLLKQGYEDSPGELVEEAAAKLATGETLGLPEADAIEFIRQWAKSYAEINGARATHKLERLHNALLEDAYAEGEITRRDDQVSRLHEPFAARIQQQRGRSGAEGGDVEGVQGHSERTRRSGGNGSPPGRAASEVLEEDNADSRPVFGAGELNNPRFKRFSQFLSGETPDLKQEILRTMAGEPSQPAQREQTELGFGGSKRASPPATTTLATVSSAPSQVPPAVAGVTDTQAIQNLRKAAKENRRDVLGAIAPTLLSSNAKESGLIVSRMAAERDLQIAQAEHAVKKARDFIDKLPRDAQLEFWQSWEEGKRAKEPLVSAAQDAIRRELDTARAELEKRGVANPDARIVDKEYLGRVWKDPDKAEQFYAGLSKRPIRGDRKYLKQRTFDWFKEGLDHGLEPVDTNVFFVQQERLRSMWKFISSLDALSRENDAGRLRFRRVFEDMPTGYATVNDPAFKKYGPPTQVIKEWIDKNVYEGLLGVANGLGISHERLASLGRSHGHDLGYSIQGGNEIKTRLGSETSVLAHEIGHQLDEKYNLWHNLLRRDNRAGIPGAGTGHKPGRSELRNIADMTGRGKTARSKEEKIAQVLEAYIHAPEEMKNVAPRVFGWFDTFVKSKPELKGLAEIKPGLHLKEIETEKAHGGLLQYGEYVLPEDSARIWNNYISQGLAKYGWYRGLRSAGNFMLSLRLIGGFHAGFAALETPINSTSRALWHAFSGRPAQAMKAAAEIPIALPATIMRGSALKSELLKGSGSRYKFMRELLMRSGGGVGTDPVWKVQTTRTMKKAFRAALDDLSEGRIAKGFVEGLTGASKIPAAAIEKLMSPIFERLMPNLKLGTWARLASDQVEAAGGFDALTPVEQDKILSQTWNSVDNRFGLLRYANLHWNAAIKDAAQLVVQSVGWNLGYREFVGAATDTGRAFRDAATGKGWQPTERMFYPLAVAIITAAIGGMMTYMLTGEWPQSYMDYMHPRTGQKDDEGRDIRLNLPTYWKDLEHWRKDPLGTFTGKMHPLGGTIAELYRNRDWYGVQIRNPQDDDQQQFVDILKFLGKSMEPYTIQNIDRERERGLSWPLTMLSLVGVTPVPRKVEQSAAQELAAEISEGKRSETITKEQAAKMQANRQLLHELRRGQTTLDQAERSGQIDSRERRQFEQKLQNTSLANQIRSFTLDETLKVYAAADEKERAGITDLLSKKVNNASRSDVDKITPQMVKQLESYGMVDDVFRHNLKVRQAVSELEKELAGQDLSSQAESEIRRRISLVMDKAMANNASDLEDAKRELQERQTQARDALAGWIEHAQRNEERRTDRAKDKGPRPQLILTKEPTAP